MNEGPTESSTGAATGHRPAASGASGGRGGILERVAKDTGSGF